MNQKETVSDYYDRLQGLLSGARHTLEKKYTRRYGQEKKSNIMLKPALDCALDASIRGLLDNTEKTRALASTFHVTILYMECPTRTQL